MLSGTALVFFGCAWWMLCFGDENTNNTLATVGGFFLAGTALFVVLLDRPQPAALDPAALADDLARTLRGQWLEEARVRRLRDPRVLPLSWRETTRNVADRITFAGTRVRGMRLDGRLEGRFEDVTRRLAQSYERVPHHRLVVLGEPGSGKTVLSVLLTLGLIDARAEGGPVPVLLSASSWDPLREELDAWIVRTLAVPYYSGRQEIPRLLLAHGLLLPLLDGLDEIPESARRSAIQGINRTIGTERPVVVTCRAAEYEDLIRGGAPVLRQAPVVEVDPVSSAEVIAYLEDLEWPNGVDWRPVIRHLRSGADRRDSPVVAALSTPLMISSARLVYQRGIGDPAELLTDPLLDSRYAVEDHVTDRLIDAAYAPDTARAGRARRWLTFLARHLHEHRERDLAWWLLSQRLLSRWTAPAIGVGGGMAFTLLATAWAVLGDEAADLQYSLAEFSISGGVFALLATVVWYGVTGRQPGRLSLTVQGSFPRLRRGFGAGLVLTSVCAGPVMLWLAFIDTVGEDGETSFESVMFLCQIFVLFLAIGIVVGLALAAHSWLDAPPSRSAQTGPVESVRQDRRSALAGAAMAGAVVSTTGWAAWGIALFLGSLLGRRLTDWPGAPAEPDIGALASSTLHGAPGVTGVGFPSEFGRVAVLLGLAFAVLVLLTRAWPRFLITRAILAARGVLPWRLFAFLTDARERGLLRQSGSTYQFRHIRMQEALAAARPAGAFAPGDRRVSRRTALAAGAVLASVGTVTAVMPRLPKDQSLVGFSRHTGWVTAVAVSPDGRLVAGGDQFGAVWLHDTHDHEDSVLLRKGHPALDVEGDEIAGLAFHPDGRTLVVAASTGQVEVWGLLQRRRLRTLTPRHDDVHDTTQALAFYSHGSFLAYGGPGKSGLRTWATDTWRMVGGMEGIAVRGLAVAPHDEAAVMILERSASNRVKVLRFAAHGSSRIAADTSPRPPYTMYQTQTQTLSGSTLSFSRDGRACATLDSNGAATLWHTDSTGRAKPFHVSGDVAALAFSRTASTTLVLAKGRTLRLYDTSLHRQFGTLNGHSDDIRSMAFAPDGTYLVTGGKDHTVRLWDVASA